MAKKKQTLLDFDNVADEIPNDDINSKNASNDASASANNNDIPNNIDNNSNIDTNDNSDSGDNKASNSIVSSVLSRSTKKPKKVYTGFYLEESVAKTVDKIAKKHQETNKSKIVNDILKEAFKEAGLL